MTAALEGGEWSKARPGRTLPPVKTRYPFYRRLGGLQGRSTRAENLVATGIRSQTVQPVVSRYTDWASRPTHILIFPQNFQYWKLTHILNVTKLTVGFVILRTHLYTFSLYSLVQPDDDLIRAETYSCSYVFNLLVPELFFFLILAHPVCKMWMIQEPNMLELWNKLYFEEKKTESIYHV